MEKFLTDNLIYPMGLRLELGLCRDPLPSGALHVV